MSAIETYAVQGTAWTVGSVDLGNYVGVAQDDILWFPKENFSIQRQMEASRVDWATSYTIGNDGLEGFTPDGRAFRIEIEYYQPDPDKPRRRLLTCYCPNTASRRRQIRAAGLSAGLGTLIGVAAGVAGSQPLAGALIGLSIALTSSLVTGSVTNPAPLRTGSQGTFVAEEGGPGVIINPGPLAVGAA